MKREENKPKVPMYLEGTITDGEGHTIKIKKMFCEFDLTQKSNLKLGIIGEPFNEAPPELILEIRARGSPESIEILSGGEF